jgi:hypothetical protein
MSSKEAEAQINDWMQLFPVVTALLVEELRVVG